MSSFFDHAVTRLATADLKAETDGNRVGMRVGVAGMPKQVLAIRFWLLVFKLNN